jgi:hypothetical protein
VVRTSERLRALSLYDVHVLYEGDDVNDYHSAAREVELPNSLQSLCHQFLLPIKTLDTCLSLTMQTKSVHSKAYAIKRFDSSIHRRSMYLVTHPRASWYKYRLLCKSLEQSRTNTGDKAAFPSTAHLDSVITALSLKLDCTWTR